MTTSPMPTERRPGRAMLRWRAVAAVVVLPALLFVVVQPDWYYLQNGLDPFFYTGYVQNFNNLFYAAGARHYFISRWTIYLPQRALLWILGDPRQAYLLFRWIGSAIVVGWVLRLSNGRWRRNDALALAVLVLVMPMTIRTLLTDYSDAVVFPLGTALIAVLALYPDRARAAALAGALGGAMVVANPFGATIALAAAPLWLRRVPVSRWATLVAASAAGALVVVLGGMAFFRWRYGLANVYSPTIDFIRTKGTSQDPLKSPRLWWLGYRLWIYVPGLTLGVFYAMRRWGRFKFDSAELAIAGTCLVQYVFQIWFQFSRHGTSLEISYYWSYIMPSFALTFCIVAGALAKACGPRHLPSVALICVLLIRIIGSPTPEIIQSWIDGLLLIVLCGYVGRRTFKSRPALASIGLVGAVFLPQTSGPRPEPILPDELRVLSSYELVYRQQSSPGIESFDAATWFVGAMDRLPEPVVRSAVFWYEGAIPARMSAMFGVQVSGRWLNPGMGASSPMDPFPPDVRNAILAGDIPTIVAIGPASDVEAMARQFAEIEPRMHQWLAEAVPHQDGLEVRVLSTLGP